MKFICLSIILFIISCSSPGTQPDSDYTIALLNANLANEGFIRCQNYMTDWLEFADPETGLIPRNLYKSDDIWNAQDAAADNYPFMVLTTAMIDREMFEGRMSRMLESEIKHTSRLHSLPDTYSFPKNAFLSDRIDTASIIFGSSEYIKDGLLPLTEWLGPSPWSDRMIKQIDDIWRIAPVQTPYGNIPSDNVEINGEMLQALSRIYHMTGDPEYLEWAIRLGDYYLLGNHHPVEDFEVLRLRDHGCEIVSGLCELYVALNYSKPEKKAEYRDPIYKMMNVILENGTNEHGMFYNNIDPQTGKILGNENEIDRVADTWGYTYNGFYAIYMTDSIKKYRDAVLTVLENLDHYKNYDWESGSADGYADAIESALNLYNREPSAKVAGWIDSEIQIMWSMQDSSYRESAQKWKNKGIIEGWHGDGNFARTTLMYCLWKTQGIYIHPWKPELCFGAVAEGTTLKISINTEIPWVGKFFFDRKRHKEYLDLPIDYPRINQFPEWYTVSKDSKYSLKNLLSGEKISYSGESLISGITLTLTDTGNYYYELKEILD